MTNVNRLNFGVIWKTSKFRKNSSMIFHFYLSPNMDTPKPTLIPFQIRVQNKKILDNTQGREPLLDGVIRKFISIVALYAY